MNNLCQRDFRTRRTSFGLNLWSPWLSLNRCLSLIWHFAETVCGYYLDDLASSFKSQASKIRRLNWRIPLRVLEDLQETKSYFSSLWLIVPNIEAFRNGLGNVSWDQELQIYGMPHYHLTSHPPCGPVPAVCFFRATDSNVYQWLPS